MIEIKNLTKHFENNLILDSLNLKIETGETKVIIGRSGCGKSVLLKHIVGLIKPEQGTILVDNQDISKLDEKKMNQLHMKIGMVFQGGALFDSLSVWENVGFVLREYSTLKEDEIRKRVKESLALVNLYDIEDKMPSELSGGMKKRASLARALCVRPQIILYDEPTTGIDP
ncbi:MAG: ATP-binding cassette domain-containing protein, partial [Candidatus Omnitrophota bacterium]